MSGTVELPASVARSPAVRRTFALGSAAAGPLLAALRADTAFAQGLHAGAHEGGARLSLLEVLVGIAHGATLTAAVLLAGLPAFAALIWLPASRDFGVGQEGVLRLRRVAWVLLGLLLVAGLAEVSLYAVQASDQPLGLSLFGQALLGTRVGHVWLARAAFASTVVLAATWAIREERPSFWWVAATLAGVLLLTLSQLSHAAAEGRFLPFFADWLHVIAASVWIGGLLGFPVLLLGPLRAMPPEERSKLLVRAVSRFSKVATAAVTVLLVTGTYAALLHVPSFAALIGTPYGRALIMKLGLVVFVLAIGAMNFLGGGRGPFSRMVGAEFLLALGIFVATGFLTSLPPPGP
jgi:copper transport protein